MKSILRSGAMLIGLVLAGCAARPALRTVPSVDPARYAGTWHEIARYPNWFQRGCERNTTAEYTLEPGGSLRVTNRCTGKNGKPMSVTGTATVVPGSGNAKLKVGFGGPFRGDYWIIGLDEKNYSWAVVGHPSRQFLWILAREPRLPMETYDRLVALAVAQGYDARRIVRDPRP